MIVRSVTVTTLACSVAVMLLGGCGQAEYEARMKKKASQLSSGVSPIQGDEEPEPESRNIEEDRQADTDRSRRPGAMTLGAAFRTQSKGNLRQLGQALINYESQNGKLPPRYLSTTDGQPGLSWRVALLPFLDENVLYNQFHLNEPWDSEHNRPLVANIPNIYRLPQSNAEDGRTNYLGIAGPDSVFVDGDSVRTRDVRDGTSKTLFVLEVDDSLAVEWTKPDDFEWRPENPTSGLGGLYKAPVFIAAFLDARVIELPRAIANDELTAMLTIKGGERVNTDF